MNALARVLREVVDLFVEDGSLASGTILVVGFAWACGTLLRAGALSALLLCVGLLGLIAENVRRAARSAGTRER